MSTMHNHSKLQPFSMRWVWISGAIFLTSHLVLGFVLADLAKGAALSEHTRFLIEAVLNLAGYFIGGVVVGLISPGLRIREPAIGAVACVALMFVVAAFTPLTFVKYSLTKFAIGGTIAFLLALVGARLGELLSGNRLPRHAHSID